MEIFNPHLNNLKFNDDEDFERVQFDKGFRMVRINPDEVYNDTVYVVYEVKGEIPRLERLKITKEKKKYHSFELYPWEDPFKNRTLDFAIQIPEILIHSVATDHGYEENNYVQYHVLEEISKLENRLIKYSKMQIRDNGFKLKINLFSFMETEVDKNVDHYLVRNQYLAYKKIGIIMYHTNELNSHAEKYPYI